MNSTKNQHKHTDNLQDFPINNQLRQDFNHIESAQLRPEFSTKIEEKNNKNSKLNPTKIIPPPITRHTENQTQVPALNRNKIKPQNPSEEDLRFR